MGIKTKTKEQLINLLNEYKGTDLKLLFIAPSNPINYPNKLENYFQKKELGESIAYFDNTATDNSDFKKRILINAKVSGLAKSNLVFTYSMEQSKIIKEVVNELIDTGVLESKQKIKVFDDYLGNGFTIYNIADIKQYFALGDTNGYSFTDVLLYKINFEKVTSKQYLMPSSIDAEKIIANYKELALGANGTLFFKRGDEKYERIDELSNNSSEYKMLIALMRLQTDKGDNSIEISELRGYMTDLNATSTTYLHDRRDEINKRIKEYGYKVSSPEKHEPFFNFPQTRFCKFFRRNIAYTRM